MILLFFISSCRKVKDIEAPPEKDDTAVKKFFQIPEGASEGLISVIADIKKQNDKNNFVNQLSVKYGFPAWDKTVANISIKKSSNNPNARSAAADSLQLFLIPFRASDSSVSSYLVCAKNGNDYTYRYYKKGFLSSLYAANDTVKQLREGLLGAFSYFEKKINNKDSIYIGGVYKKVVKDVTINFNRILANGRSQVNSSITVVTVCYTTSIPQPSTDPQARTTSHAPEACISIGVYGSMLDLGFTSSGGYSSGTSSGSGGGGSTGGNSFPDGFQCPQSEWWCESGEYKLVDGVFYTSDAYPGAEKGLPWLWWENSSLNTFVAPPNFPLLDNPDYFKCFTNDPTSTYKITLAVDQPNAGTRDTYTFSNSGNSSSSGPVNTGHTFLILEQIKSNGTRVIRNIGYYPKESVKPLVNPISDGAFVNDEFHEYDVSLTTTVSESSFFQFLEILKNSSSEQYNLNDNNCSSFCTKKLRQIGIEISETSGRWPFGSGVNPGDLGEDIRQMQLLPNQTRNNSGGNAPLNLTTC